jgi:hypothetical protein
VLFHDFAYFLFLFLLEFSVSFIIRIDSLATRETIIAVSFWLFSSFYCFLSHLYIYLDCAAKLVLFGVGLSSARTARRYERCERVRILRVFERNTSNVRILFLPPTNFCR